MLGERGVSKKWPIFAYDSTDRLREKRTLGGGGPNPENFAYVLNGCSLTGYKFHTISIFDHISPTNATIFRFNY